MAIEADPPMVRARCAAALLVIYAPRRGVARDALRYTATDLGPGTYAKAGLNNRGQVVGEHQRHNRARAVSVILSCSGVRGPFLYTNGGERSC